MARLTVGWPVIGGRTADGMDAIYSITPADYALAIGMGSMSLQNAGSVLISGGNISNVSFSSSNVSISGGNISNVSLDSVTSSDFEVIGDIQASGSLYAGISVTAGTIYAEDSISVGEPMTMSGGGNFIGVGDTAANEWIYAWSGQESRIGIYSGSDLRIMTESAPGLDDGVDIIAYDGALDRLDIAPDLKVLSNIGFFGTTPIAKITIPANPAYVTTETAGATYTTNEQNMMNHLKTDMLGLRVRLINVFNALKSYGLMDSL